MTLGWSEDAYPVIIFPENIQKRAPWGPSFFHLSFLPLGYYLNRLFTLPQLDSSLGTPPQSTTFSLVCTVNVPMVLE